MPRDWTGKSFRASSTVPYASDSNSVFSPDLIPKVMARLPTTREIWVDALTDREFPTRRRDSSIVSNVFGGPVHDEKEARARYVASEKFRAQISALPDTELQARYQVLQSEQEAARFFNLPAAGAEFHFWAAASYWTLDEAVALSLGKNPRVVNWKTIEPARRQSPFVATYADRRELVNRAKTMGQLWEPSSPSTFLAWAERMRFPMPEALVLAVKDLGIQICDWKSLFERQKQIAEEAQADVKKKHADHLAAMADHSQSIVKMRAHNNEMSAGYKELLAKRDELIDLKDRRIENLTARITELEAMPATEQERTEQERPLGTRERDSLLKLIIGMAIDGYGFDPMATKSPTAKELADHLDRLGLSLSDDTIRNYLKQAKELFPGGDLDGG